MKSILFAARACALLLVLAGSAAAAAPRRAELGDPPNEPRDIRALRDFSVCTVRRDRDRRRARALLAMDSTTDAYRTALLRFVGDHVGCLPSGQLRFSRVLFAGGLAESLLRDSLAGSALAARVTHDPARPPLQARDEGEMMSLCTVRQAPGEISALFGTEPASDAEGQALRAVTPQMQQCLAANLSFRVNRVELRSRLALAAYRLVEHNRQAAAAAMTPSRP